MKWLYGVRFLTYAVLIGIAIQLRERIRLIPVPLAGKEEYRGVISMPPGEGWFPPSEWSAYSRPPIEVFPRNVIGTSVDYLTQKLGEPSVRLTFRCPLPDVGVTQGVQKVLLAEFPEYKGNVESFIWKKNWKKVTRWYQAFFVNQDGYKTLIELISWKDGVQI